MMGCRALYHDGWKAVAFHPLTTVDYGDGRDPRAPFDEDEWELYHVAEDLSEIDDLADEGAGQAPRADRRCGGARPSASRCCRSTTSPAATATVAVGSTATCTTRASARLPEAVAPNLRNRGFHITAELDLGRRRECRRRRRRPRRPAGRLRDLHQGQPAALRPQPARRRGHHRVSASVELPPGATIGASRVHTDRPVPGRCRAVLRRRPRRRGPRRPHDADLVRRRGLQRRLPARRGDHRRLRGAVRHRPRRAAARSSSTASARPTATCRPRSEPRSPSSSAPAPVPPTAPRLPARYPQLA